MTFSEINEAHKNALQVVTNGVAVRALQHEQIEIFYNRLKSFKGLVDRLDAGEATARFITQCKTFHSRICLTPCRPSWLYSSFTASIQLIREGLKREIESADPEIRKEFEHLRDCIKQIGTIDVNPLASASGELRGLVNRSAECSESLVIAIRNLRDLKAEIISVLNPEGTHKNLKILKPSELRKAAPSDRLVLFGPPNFFKPNHFRPQDELFLFRAPVAPVIDLFVYNHFSGGFIHLSALDDQLIRLNGMHLTMPSQRTTSVEEPLYPTLKTSSSWNIKAQEDIPVGDQDTLFDAWSIHLPNRKLTYLDPDGSVPVLLFYRDEDKIICSDVELRDVEELETDDILFLTTTGSGDLLCSMADEIMGENATHYRACQEDWKLRLRQQVNHYGVEGVAEDLKKRGITISNPNSLRTWISENNHGPKDLGATFSAILDLLNLESKAENYRAAIKALRSASREAGRRLNNSLKASMQGTDIRKVLIDGFMEVRAESNGPSKTAFLVEHINRATTPIPAHCLGRVFDLED